MRPFLSKFSFLVFAFLLATNVLAQNNFVNGTFETGDLTGWIQGGGRWGCGGACAPGGTQPNPDDYLPAYSYTDGGGTTNIAQGRYYNPTYAAITMVTDTTLALL